MVGCRLSPAAPAVFRALRPQGKRRLILQHAANGVAGLAPPSCAASCVRHVCAEVLLVAVRLPAKSNALNPAGCVQAPNEAVLKDVANAISSLGMLAVTGFKVDDVAHQALSHFASCALRGDIHLREVRRPMCAM